MHNAVFNITLPDSDSRNKENTVFPLQWVKTEQVSSLPVFFNFSMDVDLYGFLSAENLEIHLKSIQSGKIFRTYCITIQTK